METRSPSWPSALVPRNTSSGATVGDLFHQQLQVFDFDGHTGERAVLVSPHYLPATPDLHGTVRHPGIEIEADITHFVLRRGSLLELQVAAPDADVPGEPCLAREPDRYHRPDAIMLASMDMCGCCHAD